MNAHITATKVNALHVFCVIGVLLKEFTSEMAERCVHSTAAAMEYAPMRPPERRRPNQLHQNFKTGKKGRNQQRRTELHSADRLLFGNSRKGIATHTDCARAKCALASRSRTTLTPAMLMRNPAAARAASSAVTGPCTTEYGPLIAGKKKIESTQKTAISASAPSIWLNRMGISTIIR